MKIGTHHKQYTIEKKYNAKEKKQARKAVNAAYYAKYVPFLFSQLAASVNTDMYLT